MSAASFEYRGHTIEVRRASLISSETSLVINGETQDVISGIIKIRVFLPKTPKL